MQIKKADFQIAKINNQKIYFLLPQISKDFNNNNHLLIF